VYGKGILPQISLDRFGSLAVHSVYGLITQKRKNTMTSLETIRKFKTKNFAVVVDAVEEFDLDLSWDDTGETLKGLHSGKLVAFCARVRVFFKGMEVGSDYLGNCIYTSPGAFMDHVGANGQYGSYFTDMVSTAIEEARKNIAQLQAVRVHQ
jgi:hypothetical protein